METGQNLYFLGIIAPELIASEIKGFQEHCAQKYKSKAALKIPPHLTLIPPFYLERSREAELTNAIGAFAAKQRENELSIQGFNSFGAGTIYVAFEKNPALKNMQKELALLMSKKFGILKKDGPAYAFTPHITVAYKDLSPLRFEEAMTEFQRRIYRRKWKAASIAIVRNDFGKWNTVMDLEFNFNKTEILLEF
jgi:2'-5' RNA ligase